MFLFAFKLLTVLLTLNNVDGLDFGHSARMFEGDDAKIEDFPYFASLRDCGASVLSNRWIVTAAHCVPKNPRVEGRNYVWVGGESFNNSKRVTYDKVVTHPSGFLPEYLPWNDIALLRLTEPLEFTDKIRPIDLPSDDVHDRKLVLVARGIDETGRLSTDIKKTHALRQTTEECLSQISYEIQAIVRPYLSFIEKSFICSLRQESKPGVCRGDSGSPLAQGNTLVGIVSFGITDDVFNVKCMNAPLGFYVNVATYVPWIKAVTGLE